MVDLDKNIEMSEVQSNCRVALRNDSYKLHKILPNKVRDQNASVYVCMHSHDRYCAVGNFEESNFRGFHG